MAFNEELHVEPIFSAFLCPLTKQIMQDPVTIENGHTFEREAIEDWFKECRETGQRPTCPLTLVELQNADLKPSIALKNAIEEWTQRKEAAQLNMAYRSLSPSTSESDALHALNLILNLCQKSRSNKLIMCDTKLMPVITSLLKNNSWTIRCKVLEILCVLAEERDDSKEAMAVGDNILTLIKLLSHEHYQERRLAVSLLYELSKSISLCERIGGVHGTILILVGLASSKSEEIWITEKAEKTLQNLEKCEGNIRKMAENGRMQPLLTLLLQGPPATQLLMASHLEELALTNDVKVLMAEKAGSLISVLSNGTMQAREVALKALNKISSYEVSAKILVQSGILPPLAKGLFDVGINQLPMKLKEISATILANIVVCGADIESIQIDDGGLTLVSEVFVQDLIHFICTAGPVIECKLLKVLAGLTSSSKIVQKIASIIKSSDAINCLTRFIEAPQRDIRLASIKILQNISPYMGEELTMTFKGAVGRLGALIRVASEKNETLEEQTTAIGLLANLPERNSILTKHLWNEGIFEIAISKLIKIQRGETRSNRSFTPLLEGLVKVLSKLTYVLHDETEYITFACQHKLAALFADMLQINGLDKIQIVSAIALENLSRASKILTKAPEIQKPGCCRSISMCFSKPSPVIRTCHVHHGICSMKDNFCLVEGSIVEKLVACLDHTNVNVVEAALAAICTLLDDSVDIEQGVIVLLEADGIGLLLDILLQNQSAILQQRAVWAIERILRMEEMASEVSEDPSIVSALIEAFQHGDNWTRQIAEQALKHVNKLPNFSGSV